MFCSNPQLFVNGLYVVLMATYCTSKLWQRNGIRKNNLGILVNRGKNLLSYLITQKQTTNEAKQKLLQNSSPIDNF
jgi:hypothetical protein